MKTKTPKAPVVILKENHIYGARLLIYRNIGPSKPTAVNLWAILPHEDYDGKALSVYDWKTDFENKTIYLRGAMYLGGGNYQKVEATFKCQLEEVDMKPPGRNWEWSKYGSQWRNTKTGERRKAN